MNGSSFTDHFFLGTFLNGARDGRDNFLKSDNLRTILRRNQYASKSSFLKLLLCNLSRQGLRVEALFYLVVAGLCTIEDLQPLPVRKFAVPHGLFNLSLDVRG